MSSIVQACRGRYQYLCNGAPTGIEESWQISDQSGQRRVHSVRRAGSAGITLSVDSRQQGSDFHDCSICWQQRQNGDEFRLEAHYRFSADGFVLHRHWQNREEEPLTADPDGRFIFSPLMRVYTGPVIRQLQANGGEGRVMVPWIRDPAQPQKLLLPSYSTRRVERLGEDELSVDGMATACEKFDYSGGEYEPGSHFWLGEGDILLRYCWQQDPNTRWDVSLLDYQAQP